jgi:hypothetical protein
MSTRVLSVALGAALAAVIGFVVTVCLFACPSSEPAAAARVGEASTPGWYCTSRDGSCYSTREECATQDRDGSGQDAPSCHWQRHAYVTTYYGAATAAFETEAICSRWRRALDARDRMARTTRCLYRAPEEVSP